MPYVNQNGQTVFVPDGYQYYNTGGIGTPTLAPIPGWQTGQPTPGAVTLPKPPTLTPTPSTSPLTPSQLAWQNAKQILQGRRAQTLQNYGVDESGHMDPNNQYGQARQLLERYGQQVELARIQNANRHIGQHGLANQSHSLIQHLLGGASARLSQDFLGRVAGIDMDISKLGPKPNQ